MTFINLTSIKSRKTIDKSSLNDPSISLHRIIPKDSLFRLEKVNILTYEQFLPILFIHNKIISLYILERLFHHI